MGRRFRAEVEPAPLRTMLPFIHPDEFMDPPSRKVSRDSFPEATGLHQAITCRENKRTNLVESVRSEGLPLCGKCGVKIWSGISFARRPSFQSLLMLRLKLPESNRRNAPLRSRTRQPSENHPSAQPVDAARLLQGFFRLLGVVEYLPRGLSGRLDPIEGGASLLGHDP